MLTAMLVHCGPRLHRGAVRYSGAGFTGGQAEVKGTNVTSSTPVTNPELVSTCTCQQR
jgi:hypothetical protein